MTCKPAELALISFPYTDLSAAKRRPVLVLTAPDRRGDFIAIAVTSVPQTEPAVCLDASGMKHGELPRASWIRTDKVFTLNTAAVVKVLGVVQEVVLHMAVAELCEHVGREGVA